MKKLNYIGSTEALELIKKNTANYEKENFIFITKERNALNQLMTNKALLKRKEEQNKFLDKLMSKFKILDSKENKNLMLGVIENQAGEMSRTDCQQKNSILISKIKEKKNINEGEISPITRPSIVLPRIEKSNEILYNSGKKKGLVFSFILPRVSGDKVWHRDEYFMNTYYKSRLKTEFKSKSVGKIYNF